MGALLPKPSAQSYRNWDSTVYMAYNYFDIGERPVFHLLTVPSYSQTKVIKISPAGGWISNRVRFSYDGLQRQRITRCYIGGEKATWAEAFSLLFEYFSNKDIFFHWSSLEPAGVRPIIKLAQQFGSSISLPFGSLYGSKNQYYDDPNGCISITQGWSLFDEAPVYSALFDISSYEINSFSKRLSNLSNQINFFGRAFTLNRKLNQVAEPARLDFLQTTSFQTEETSVAGSSHKKMFRNKKKATVCFVQTEHVTVPKNSYKSVYFGTHAYVNIQRIFLLFPSLLPYERKNFVTEFAFLQGPRHARSYFSYYTTFIQLCAASVSIFKCSAQGMFFRGYPEFISSDISIKSEDSSSLNLHFTRLAPELAISNIQQCLIS